MRTVFALIAMVFVIQQTAPEMPKIHQLQIQALAAKREAVSERMARIQLEYKDLQGQYAKLGSDLDAEVRAAYAETKVDPKLFAITADGQFKFIPPDEDKPDAKDAKPVPPQK